MLTWLMALCMVCSAVARIVIPGVKGSGDSLYVWSQIVLPAAAAVLYALIALVNGKELFYKTAIPVWMAALYSGIWVSENVQDGLVTWLFWIALVFYAFFYTEITTGLRRGEICGLKWSDIDFDANKLRVQRSVSAKKGGGLNIVETKTNTGTRIITMPPSVREVLQNRRQTAITEWVFPAFLNPEQPIHPEAAYRKLKVILKHAELPLIRFHDLRHTFATHAMKGGVDPKTLSGILGHTNASFTLDTYTHVTSDMQKNASAVVGNMMQKIMIKE